MKTLSHSIKFLTILFVSALLLTTSCKEDDENKPDNSIVVDAGTDFSSFADEQVELVGSSSGTPPGAATYLWEFTVKPVGSKAILKNPTSLYPSFTPDLEGVYEIKLIVSAGSSMNSDVVKVTVTIPAEASILVSGNIDSDIIWKDHVSDSKIPDYIVTKEVFVNARLTIEPNVFIQIKEGIGIRVSAEGTLISAGTPGNEVIMTSSSPGEGLYWKGIMINSNSTLNKLEHTHVLYAGHSAFSGSAFGSAVTVSKGKISLKNSKIGNSLNYGILIKDGELNEFSLNTFENIERYAIALSTDQAGKLDNNSTFSNPAKAVELYAGTIISSKNIVIPDLPENARYFVNGNLILKSYFEVSPGAILDFAMDASVVVETDGTFVANGTEGKPIIFTSSRADEGLNWKGFHIKSLDPRNSFNHSEINYAGSSAWNFPGPDYAAAIGIDNGSVKVTNTKITNSKDYGIYLLSGALNGFSSNTFSDNKGNAIAMMADEVHNIDKNTSFSNNGWDGVVIYKSTLSKESTWVKLKGNASYKFIEWVLLSEGLAVDPGTKMTFDENVFLKVQDLGYFSAIGTAADPIIMTSSNVAGGRYWGGIWLRTKDARNAFDHVEISYAGGVAYSFAGPDFAAAIAGDDHDMPTVNVTNTIIQESKSYAIYWEGGIINNVLAAEAKNTFRNNGITPDVFIP